MLRSQVLPQVDMAWHGMAWQGSQGQALTLDGDALHRAPCSEPCAGRHHRRHGAGLEGAHVTPDSLPAVKAAASLPHPPRAMAAAIGGWKVERRGNVNFTATTSYSISISIIRATVDVIAKAAANTPPPALFDNSISALQIAHRINPPNCTHTQEWGHWTLKKKTALPPPLPHMLFLCPIVDRGRIQPHRQMNAYFAPCLAQSQSQSSVSSQGAQVVCLVEA
jgi:hypothetical protein